MFDCFKYNERISTTFWLDNGLEMEFDWRDFGEDWDDLYGCIITLGPAEECYGQLARRIVKLHKAF